MTKPKKETVERCRWFAACRNPATTTKNGPIGDGKFGPVPICQRCADWYDRMSAPKTATPTPEDREP